MPSKPKFDREHVVGKAMEVFWDDGYACATLQTLGHAMALQPGSIYAAFGSKDALFREALQLYVRQVREQLEDAQDEHLDGWALLQGWFEQHVERSTATPIGRGCLLLNSAAESQTLDAESADLVRCELARLTRFLGATVRQIRQKDGTLPRDCEAVANTLAAALCGISVLARAGADRKSLLAVARLALEPI